MPFLMCLTALLVAQLANAVDSSERIIGSFTLKFQPDVFSKHGTTNVVATTVIDGDYFALRCLEGELSFVVESERNDFEIGERLDVRYKVDDADIHDLLAVAVSRDTVATQFAHGIFDELGKANTIYVRIEGRSVNTFHFLTSSGDEAASAVKTACGQ